MAVLERYVSKIDEIQFCRRENESSSEFMNKMKSCLVKKKKIDSWGCCGEGTVSVLTHLFNKKINFADSKVTVRLNLRMILPYEKKIGSWCCYGDFSR